MTNMKKTLEDIIKSLPSIKNTHTLEQALGDYILGIVDQTNHSVLTSLITEIEDIRKNIFKPGMSADEYLGRTKQCTDVVQLIKENYLK